MKSVAALTIVCCLVVAIRGASPDDVVPEAPASSEVEPLREEGLLQEGGFMLPTRNMALLAAVQGAKARLGAEVDQSRKVIDAIVDFKAYCQTAVNLKFATDAGDKDKNALFAMIEAFAPDSKNKDIITQYGLVMGKLKEGRHGVFKYVFDGINNSILKGETVLVASTQDGAQHMQISTAALGMQDAPDYVKALSVNTAEYLGYKEQLHAGDGGKAIADWIRSGTANIYDRCFKKNMALNVEEQKKYDSECAAACEKVIHEAFLKADAKEVKTATHKLDTVRELSPTCRSGNWKSSPEVCKKNVVNAKVVSEACHAEASKTMEDEAKKVDLARVEKELEAKAAADKKAAADAAAK